MPRPLEVKQRASAPRVPNRSTAATASSTPSVITVSGTGRPAAASSTVMR